MPSGLRRAIFRQLNAAKRNRVRQFCFGLANIIGKQWTGCSLALHLTRNDVSVGTFHENQS
jgi:hypothetical protein